MTFNGILLCDCLSAASDRIEFLPERENIDIIRDTQRNYVVKAAILK